MGFVKSTQSIWTISLNTVWFVLTEVTVKGQVHYGEVLLKHNARRGHNQDRKWKWRHFLTFQTLQIQKKRVTLFWLSGILWAFYLWGNQCIDVEKQVWGNLGGTHESLESPSRLQNVFQTVISGPFKWSVFLPSVSMIYHVVQGYQLLPSSWNFYFEDGSNR